MKHVLQAWSSRNVWGSVALLTITLGTAAALAQSRTGSVTGIVRLADGKPAVGARVAALEEPVDGNAANASAMHGITVTDSSGRYQIDGIPPGKYLIVAGRLDAPTYYPGVTASSSASPVEAKAGQTVSGIDFRAQAVSIGLRVSGRLVRANGAAAGPAITGVTEIVTLLGTTATFSFSGPLQSAVDALGAFEFQQVPPGAYTLSVNSPGALSRSIVLTDNSVEDIELNIVRWFLLNGRIGVEHGGPIPRPSLTFSGPSGNATVTPSTQRDGSFSASVPEGEYTLSVGGFPNVYRLDEMTLNSANAMKGPIRIAGVDSASLQIRFAVPEGVLHKVTGHVTSGLPTNSSVAVIMTPTDVGNVFGASFSAVTSSSPSNPFATSNAAPVSSDGSFEFPAVLPGAYSVSTQPNPPGSTKATIVVFDEDVRGVELTIPRQIQVSGKLHLDEGLLRPNMAFSLSPVSGGNVAAVTLPSFSISASFRADGSFTATLPVGEYVLRPLNLSPLYGVDALLYGSANLEKDRLRLVDGDVKELTVRLRALQPTVKVSGRVLEASAEFLGAGRVVISERSLGGTLESKIAPDGSFEFARVLPGNYVLRANPATIGSTTANVTVIDRDVSGLELRVPAPIQVSGRLVVEDGGPLTRLMLFVNRLNVTQPLTLNPTINASGAFTVTLPAGEQTLSLNPASAPGGFSGTAGTFGANAADPLRGYAVKAITYGGADALAGPITLVPGNSHELIITLRVTAPMMKISGLIVTTNPAFLASGRVSLAGASLPGPSEVRPGAEGLFEFPKLLAGTYSLSPNPAAVGARPVVITLVDKDVGGVELRVPAQIQVRGRVVVEDGGGAGPLPSFQVEGIDTPVRATAYRPTPTSPPNAAFTVVLPDGERNLKVVNLPAGYALKSVRYGDVDLISQPRVRLDAGNAQELIIVLELDQPAFSISGHVVSTNPTFLASGRVNLSGGSLGGPLEIRPGPNGSFEFPKLLAGRYTLTPNPTSVGSKPLVLTLVDKNIGGVELLVPGQVQALGRVIVEEGSVGPLPSFQVEGVDTPVRASVYRPTPTSPQPPNAGFTVILPDGERSLKVVNLPSGYALKSVRYGDVDLINQPRVRLAADNPQELIIVLRIDGPTFVISGRVSGIENLAKSTAAPRVVLTGTTLAGNLEAPIRENGQYQFSGILPGSYTVRVDPSTVTVSKAITVAERDMLDVTLSVPVSLRLTIRSIVEGGNVPPPAFTYRLISTSNSGVSNSSQPLIPLSQMTGSVSTVTLAEGEYRLEVRQIPSQFLLKSASFGSTNLLGQPFKVAAGDTREAVITFGLAVKTVRVSGQIANFVPPPPPIGSVSVTLVPQTVNIFPQTRNQLIAPVRSDGSFEFPEVLPGTYLARTEPSNTAQPKTIEVTDKDVALEWTQSSRITVQSVVEDGGTVASFRLRLNDQTFQMPPPGRTMPPSQPPVPPGEYRVSAEGLTAGYFLKSAVYEGVDVIQNPLRITSTSAGVLLLRFARDQRATFRIRGTVSALETLPRAGTRRVSLRGPNSWMDNATIGDDGSFEFSTLYPGVYGLRLESGAGPAGVIQNVTITDRDVIDVALRPEATSELALHVTATGDFPPPGISLRFSSRSSQGTGQILGTASAPTGRANTQIRPGDYDVSVGAIHPAYVLQSLMTADGRDLRSEPIHVPPSSRLEITVVLAPRPGAKLHKVSGRLAGEFTQGNWMMAQAPGLVFETALASDGSFEFSGIPDGTYVLLKRTSPAALAVSPLTSIQVADDLRVPDIAIPTIRKISGRVTVDGDAPTPPVALAFAPVISGPLAAPLTALAPPTSVTSPTIAAAVRGNGGVTSFEAPLAEAEYRLRLPAIPPGYRLKSIIAAGIDRTNSAFRIDASFQGEILVTLEPVAPIPWVRARGKIVGLAPSQGTKIAIVGNSPTDNWETAVGADGEFEFPRVTPGAYTAIILPLDNPPQTQRVAIDAENATNLQIALAPRRLTRGRIVVEGAGTPPNIRLQLDRLHPASTSAAAPQAPPMEIRPDADGQFTLTAVEGVYLISVTGVPPEYQLRSAIASGKDLLLVPLQIPEADEIVLTFTRR